MSVLSRVTTGRQRKPVTVCVWGQPGVGKTSFAAGAPGVLVMDVEGGSTSMDVARLPAPESWGAFVADLRDLVSDPHDYKTLAVDTLDALEALAIRHVCDQGKKDTLADFAWGAGYALLVQEWRYFLRALERLRDKRGMNIVLIAHEHRKTMQDPELGPYEMYRPKLQDKVWGLTNEWCDAVLFAQFDTALLEKDGQRARAIVTGRRVLRTERGTGFLAKNRFGLPAIIDLDWRTFEAAAQPVALDELKARLEAALVEAEPGLAEKVYAYVQERGNSPSAYRAATERVNKLASKKEGDT